MDGPKALSVSPEVNWPKRTAENPRYFGPVRQAVAVFDVPISNPLERRLIDDMRDHKLLYIGEAALGILIALLFHVG
jgi:hypothetical protein